MSGYELRSKYKSSEEISVSFSTWLYPNIQSLQFYLQSLPIFKRVIYLFVAHKMISTELLLQQARSDEIFFACYMQHISMDSY